MQANSNTVALVGASGLIGSALLPLLCQQWREVRVITRRPLGHSQPQVKEYVVSFTDMGALQASLAGCKHVFCAVGTTQSKVGGDHAAYRRVDYDIPLNVAKAAKAVGVEGYWLVSSVGANSHSGNFYLRLKGETEDAVSAAGLPQLGIFRPSMLLGQRSESRPAESFGQWIMPILSPLMPSRYRPIQGSQVAQAMVAAALQSRPGKQVWSYLEMMEAVRATGA